MVPLDPATGKFMRSTGNFTSATLWRNDLISLLPSSSQAGVYALVDPNAVWKNIQGMSVFNSLQAQRGCQPSQPVITKYPGDTSGCVGSMLDLEYKNFTVFMYEQQETRRYAGPLGLNVDDWQMWPQCESESQKCFVFTKTDEVPDEVKHATPNADGYLLQKVNDNCQFCQKKYRCVPEFSKNNQDLPVEEKDRFAGYVYPDGSNFSHLYFDPNDVWNTVVRQCIFDPQDFEAWVDTLKSTYWALNSRSSVPSTELANPLYPLDFSNEVILNFSDDSEETQLWNGNAVLGISFVGNSCTDRLRNLNGVVSDDGSGQVFYNAFDRCLQWKETQPSQNQQDAHKIQTKYHPKTQILEMKPLSSRFVDAAVWKRFMMTGRGVKLSEILVS